MSLDLILGNFSKSRPQPDQQLVESPSEQIASSQPCHCGSEDFWQLKATKEWICEVCQPPPSESFVRGRRGPKADAIPAVAVIVSREYFVVPQYRTKTVRGAVVSLPKVLCPRCSGAMREESVWSDDSVTHRCYTCYLSLEPV